MACKITSTHPLHVPSPNHGVNQGACNEPRTAGLARLRETPAARSAGPLGHGPSAAAHVGCGRGLTRGRGASHSALGALHAWWPAQGPADRFTSAMGAAGGPAGALVAGSAFGLGLRDTLQGSAASVLLLQLLPARDSGELRVLGARPPPAPPLPLQSGSPCRPMLPSALDHACILLSCRAAAALIAWVSSKAGTASCCGATARCRQTACRRRA